MQERKFHCIHDLFDLRIETTDIGVGNVGNFLKNELLDIGPRKLFEEHRCTWIEKYRITGPKLHTLEFGTNFDDLLFISPTHNHRAMSIAK